MINLTRRTAAAMFVLLLLPPVLLAQRKNKIVVCKSDLFAVAKPLPQLTYQCPADATSDSDDLILKSPDRLKAIDRAIQELGSFTSSRWWESSATDLNACYLHGSAGLLSADETEQFRGPEYQPALLGDNRVRLVILPDPCYQTSYNGANAFILYRKGQNVYVTQVLDGYYSRLGKSVFLHLHYTNAGPSIRIETANISAMQPDTRDYYFVIDKVTNKAAPRRLPKRSKATRSEPQPKPAHESTRKFYSCNFVDWLYQKPPENQEDEEGSIGSVQ